MIHVIQNYLSIYLSIYLSTDRYTNLSIRSPNKRITGNKMRHDALRPRVRPLAVVEAHH